jgi:hypothetical protein
VDGKRYRKAERHRDTYKMFFRKLLTLREPDYYEMAK